MLDRIPYPAIAVDDQLRVLASSRGVHNRTALNLDSEVGKPCYSRNPVTDLGKGSSCYESCPFATTASQPAWAFSRLLEVRRPSGRRVPLDCFLLRCVTPDAGPLNLCIRRVLDRTTLITNYRAAQAAEAVTSVLQRASRADHALNQAFEIVREAAHADDIEVLRVDEGGIAPFPFGDLNGASGWLREFRQALIPHRISPSTLTVPLVAANPRGRTTLGPATGWYVAAPIAQQGRSVGALGLASRRQDFDPIAALRIMAAIVAPLSILLSRTELSTHGPMCGTENGQEARNGVVPLLRVHCLGPFRLMAGGRPVPEDSFHRKKALALLKYLVANRGRPIEREVLSEFLWPDMTSDNSGTLLRVVLHALRQGLADRLGEQTATSIIVGTAGKVCLPKNGMVWVDAEEFDKKVSLAQELMRNGRVDGAIQEGMEAVKLFQGDYFEDEPYTDWCFLERQRLREAFIDLLRILGAVLAERGRLTEAMESYRRILQVEPECEEAHRALMGLLSKAGRRDEALRQYRLCRKVLSEELGVEPSSETRRAYEALLTSA